MIKRFPILMLVLSCAAVLLSITSTAFAAPPQFLTMKQLLGKFIYFDKNLSTPGGQACASCHWPKAGYAEPDSELPVSEGVIKGRFGSRNAPTSAYAAFSPVFHYDPVKGSYVGGQFWDGRAATLADQAKGPFLNPLEMNNPDKEAVVNKVCKSFYAPLFIAVYGPGSLNDAEKAYDLIADAIAAYESTSEVCKFNSKYDLYLEGKIKLTKQEMRGLALFEGKAKCTNCHPNRSGPDGTPPLFTDFTYDNLGVPKNPDNPFYSLPPEFNPDGKNFIDLGLGGVLHDSAQYGKMKVPTLRNIAKTAPYMHNGYFKTLKDVVSFYNTRDVCNWPAPEVPQNINTEELGNLGLTNQEVDDIVAFLNTLTDGHGAHRR